MTTHIQALWQLFCEHHFEEFSIKAGKYLRDHNIDKPEQFFTGLSGVKRHAEFKEYCEDKLKEGV